MISLFVTVHQPLPARLTKINGFATNTVIFRQAVPVAEIAIVAHQRIIVKALMEKVVIIDA